MAVPQHFFVSNPLHVEAGADAGSAEQPKGELYDLVKHLLEKVQEREATIAQLQEQLGSK